MAGPSYPERRASRLFQLQYGAPLYLSRLSLESADEPTLLDLIEQTIEHTPRKRCMRAALKREPDLRCIVFWHRRYQYRFRESERTVLNY